MHHDRCENVVCFRIGPCEAKTCGQILNKADDQCGHICGADVTQHMNGRESRHGEQICCHLGGLPETPENQAAVQHFFRQRRQKYHTDEHQHIVGLRHGGNRCVIDIGKTGEKIGHDKIHCLGCSPVGHIAKDHGLNEIPDIPPSCNKGISQKSVKNTDDIYYYKDKECTQLVGIYDSGRQCAKALNIDHSLPSYALRHNHYSSGYYFYFLEERKDI